MDKKEEEFKKRLLATFKIEAGEHLKAISSGLLELEEADNPDHRMQLTEMIFREAHSLKGASRAVNLRDIETICNTLESIFGIWKQEKKVPSSDIFDKVHKIIDFMSEVLPAPETNEAILENHIAEIIDQLTAPEQELNKGDEKQPDHSVQEAEKIISQTPVSEQPEKEQIQPVLIKATRVVEKEHRSVQERQTPAETVRISRMKLDSMMMQTEEMLSVKLKLYQRFTDLHDIGSILSQFNKEFIKLIQESRNVMQFQMKEDSDPDQEKLKQFSRQLETSEKSQKLIRLMEDKLSDLIKSTGEDQKLAGRMIDNLLVEMRNILMLPISSILELFPKLVRDLSRDQGKNVELVIKGAENEVDRRILEEIKDPLIHLARNCIDHGIEKPEERIENNKPATGTINISVSQLPGNKFEIIISDDGEGIDFLKVKEAAVKEGIISEKEDITDQEAESLIYHSGITTSPMITDLSGRGLGLAIVREKVDSLGGIVTMKTERYKGTTFSIQIPLTLATYRGIFVQVSGELFVIPTANVERILRIYPNEIKMVENKQTISMNGSTLSYVNLGDILELRRKNNSIAELPGKESKQDTLHVLISGTGDNRIAFGVDKILNEQEILVKHLSSPLSRVRNIGGVTVLGSGKVVPILNVSDMLKSAVSGAVSVEKTAGAEKEEVKQRSVMVAEDSITSRMLLKDILESAGFLVKTAVDGAEALSFLREGGYDLLVSDIDMPRMNGFELTEKIRSDKALKELPVVLVTALKTREDRERGMEVGANAYIEKSSFTPQNLLNAINKLI
jgi:two-component system chemotaxis sensor kinase CheA